MGAVEVLIVQCDAPSCTAILDTLDGKPVFANREDVEHAIDVRDWLLTNDHKRVERVYCRRHWRWHFSLRVPYWGKRDRTHPGEEEGF